MNIYIIAEIYASGDSCILAKGYKTLAAAKKAKKSFEKDSKHGYQILEVEL